MYISNIKISNKPCQLSSTDDWVGDILRELKIHQQRHRPNDTTKTKTSNLMHTTRF